MESQRAVFERRQFAVSVTIILSVQIRHSRIFLPHLLRGRKGEMHGEPEVQEDNVPVEECFDCPARITSKKLAPIHPVKSGILQNACSESPRVDADLEKSDLRRNASLKNGLAKGLKKMVTKVQWLC